jgi:hypothetical protein
MYDEAEKELETRHNGHEYLRQQGHQSDVRLKPGKAACATAKMMSFVDTSSHSRNRLRG